MARYIDIQEPSLYRRALRQKKGSILLLALWSMTLLSAFAVYMGAGVREKIILVRRLDERARLRLVAEAGIRKAIVVLGREAKKGMDDDEGEQKDYDSLNEIWNNNPAAFKAISVGGGIFDVYYDCLDSRTGEAITRYGITDEERKININTAERNVLERLFIEALDLGEMDAQGLAASIVDWRDKDSELSIPFGSAEDSYYEGLSHPYEAKDGEFEVLEEVLLVRGMTAEMLKVLRNYVTIYGDGKVNINTAPREVLSALGMSDTLVDKILLFRAGDDGIAGTEDDGIFERPFEIVSELSKYYDLSISEAAELNNISNLLLDTASEHFMVRSRARLQKRGYAAEAISVIDKKGRILYWQQS